MSPSPTSSLDRTRRARDLADLAAQREPVDLLVVGGGVTGAGVALDAASRGLSVILVEKHDLAFGTSRWSSKLVHGGLRYLGTGDVGVAYESAVERGILIERTAPHLVRALPNVFPLLDSVDTLTASMVRAGYLAGDALRRAAGTSGRTLPRSRRLSALEVQRVAPTVRAAGLRGGFAFWDGQLADDARLVVGLARTAAALGARVLTRTAAVEVTGSGAVLRDTLTGESLTVHARTVVNATGVWADTLAPGITMRPSRGTHLVVRAETFGGLTSALMAPVPGHRTRFVFALPTDDDRVYVGLTDEEVRGAVPDVPTASEAEIDFLLATISRALQRPLTRADVIGTFSGLRPLLDTGDDQTSDLSRKHVVLTGDDGLVSVVGGKLTTYRRMAEDAVDAALATPGWAAARRTAGPSRTTRLPLVGAADRTTLAAIDAPPRLVARYGTEALTVVAEAGGDQDVLAPIAPHIPTTPAELAFAVRHEGALDVDDLLGRRTRVGLVEADRALALPFAEAALSLGR
ncbi:MULTISPECIES: glycerol-3-phosphate dehydrogenase/oxidase [Mumia]|uniref:glycerol-3-phosphate dehydrogenase/oxidase n=1 Tax=Mumia TaxID=1546255 RepID=UPI00141FD362|nr:MULTISPECIES: glycerol-3-phosphate dehydrogenase/oxidase [unclassified Mumia]QMW65883.1 glycerol-3-phosphate dehydrogenase/oxidase [Mumia sp. ZJ1417]